MNIQYLKKIDMYQIKFLKKMTFLKSGVEKLTVTGLIWSQFNSRGYDQLKFNH